jgi:hypothetical protein
LLRRVSGRVFLVQSPAARNPAMALTLACRRRPFRPVRNGSVHRRFRNRRRLAVIRPGGHPGVRLEATACWLPSRQPKRSCFHPATKPD